ncbi:MAG: efflux RND transporter periplasmic adaptor subunit [Acetobacter sp.]|uniref:efflux RND transporter periplasmic adaptor subunit n=1 Tax=Acetobacter sp. TaxID=440 RepID=UPI0039EC7CA1
MFKHTRPEKRVRFILMLPLLCCTMCKAKTDSAEQTAVPVVEALRVEEADQNTLSFTGFYETRRTVSLASAQSGRVAAVLVNVGQHVHKGQILVSFDKTAVLENVSQAQGELDVAQAEAAQSSSLLRRSRGLDTTGGLSTAEVEQRRFSNRASLGKARSSLASLHQTQIQAAEMDVRASEDGVVTYIAATTGGIITAGNEVVRLNAGEPEVHIQTLPSVNLKVGDKTEVIMPTTNNTTPVMATVREIDAVVDKTSQLRDVHLTLSKPLPVPFNAFVKVSFLKDHGDPLLTRIPLTALVPDKDGSAHLWVLSNHEETRLLFRRITIRELRGADALVEGLHPGEIIVASGPDTLQADQKVKIAAIRTIL